MNKVRLGDIVDIRGGKRLPKGTLFSKSKSCHPYIRVRDISEERLVRLTQEYEYIDDETASLLKRYIVNTGDIILSIVGTIGNIGIVDKSLEGANLTENCVKITNFSNQIDSDYLYYFLKSPEGYTQIQKGIVGAVQQKLPIKNIASIEIPVISLNEQHRVAQILKALDEKIKINNVINDNLLQQVITIYRDIFAKDGDEKRKVCHADEYFDISIGKTPPRKEFHWFSDNSDNSNNVKWVSISDLGSCGVFISDSSEYLTKDAIKKFNITVVPDNNVLLSFKLTVGRIAITDGSMATNEAIAHFKTENKEIIEYLYCYLKSYNFEVMGSTSSIATAVNSKIIKSMPFIVPTDAELSSFHKLACPIFNEIKIRQRESRYLATLRNVLLPKLMSGEIELRC